MLSICILDQESRTVYSIVKISGSYCNTAPVTTRRTPNRGHKKRSGNSRFSHSVPGVMGISSIVFLPFLFPLFFVSGAHGQNISSVNNSMPAIYVFGDSTVDPGNNNYITTVFKSDFPPYGNDLPGHVPSGRFTNGKLATDFIASHLGIKEYVPPYLDGTLSVEELITGVSFASAGTGYDPLTSQTFRVIPMEKQLDYFKEYKSRMEQVMGVEKLEEHIRNSGFIISAGTNDFVFTYFTLSSRRKQYSVADYQNYMLQTTGKFIQDLLDLGARKLAVVGIPPIGCLPIVMTMNYDNAFLNQGCVDSYTNMAIEYNQKLQQELQTINENNAAVHKAHIFYGDIYEALLDIIQKCNSIGFLEWRRGCCGSGFLEAGILCNPESVVCPIPSEFIFWDSIHPTERTYYLIFLAFRSMIDSFIQN